MINEIITSLKNIDNYLIILIYTLAIVVYSLFVWKFYRFLAKRDFFEINLKKYNNSEHPVLKKVFSSMLYFLEYIIIIPIFVFIWFSILSIFIIFLAENQNVEQIILISASLVASVRILSYFTTDLSKDVAKIFPFTILVIFLSNPSFITINIIKERIFEIPALTNSIVVYLVFTVAIEIIMRTILFFTYQIWVERDN